MTLLSRRNRRTTASPARGRWTAISLGLAFAGGAAAQAPAPAGSAPAPTVWNATPPPRVEPKPYPRAVPVAPPPAMPVLAPPTVPAPAAPLTFQKPAGDRVPVAPAVRSTGAPVPVITVAQQPTKPADKQPTPPAETPGTKPRETEPKPQDPKGMMQPGKGPAGPAPALPTAPGALPIKDEVFRLDSDTELNRRILKDLGRRPEEAVRVPPAQLTKADEVYQPKTLSYPPSRVLLEPNYIVHRRLYFEEPNSERYGWDAGPAQGLISTLYFYRDTLLWPHNLAAGGCKERYDTSRGKCLPGDPVPYYLYPPGFTVGGSVFEATLITGIAFIFP